MPKANAYGDTGSILGNFFNDLKRLPEQRLQDSREERRRGRAMDYQAKIQEEVERARRDREFADQAAPYGGPVLNPDGTIDRVRTATRIRKAEAIEGAVKQQAGTDYNREAQLAAEARTYGKNAPDPVAIKDRVLKGIGLHDEEGRTLGERAMGLDSGQTLGERITGREAGQSMMNKLTGRDSLVPTVGEMVGAAPGQSLMQKAVGAENGLSAGRKLLGMGKGREMDPVAMPGMEQTGMPRFQQEQLTVEEEIPLERQVMLAQRAEEMDRYGMQRKLAAEAERERLAAGRRQEELQTFRTNTGRDPSEAEFGPDGNLSAPALNAALRAKQAIALETQANTMTAAQKNAQSAVESGIRAGYISPEDRDAALAAYEQWGGKAAPFPTQERETLNFNTMTKRGLDALNEKVQKASTSNFGPIANRFRTTAGKVFGGFDEARGIEQGYEEVSKGRAFAQGGKALTPTEIAATVAQVGSPTDDDFPQRLGDYTLRLKRDLQVQLDRLRQSPYRFTQEGRMAIGQLEKELGEAQEQAAAAEAKPGAGAGGVKILSISKVP